MAAGSATSATKDVLCASLHLLTGSAMASSRFCSPYPSAHIHTVVVHFNHGSVHTVVVHFNYEVVHEQKGDDLLCPPNAVCCRSVTLTCSSVE